MSKKVFPDEIVVEVTQKDIDKARQQNRKPVTEWCPVARAAKRTLRLRSLCLKAAADRIIIYTDDRSHRVAGYQDGPKAIKFIRKFDAREPVSPITLTYKKTGLE